MGQTLSPAWSTSHYWGVSSHNWGSGISKCLPMATSLHFTLLGGPGSTHKLPGVSQLVALLPIPWRYLGRTWQPEWNPLPAQKGALGVASLLTKQHLWLRLCCPLMSDEPRGYKLNTEPQTVRYTESPSKEMLSASAWRRSSEASLWCWQKTLQWAEWV